MTSLIIYEGADLEGRGWEGRGFQTPLEFVE
jgi:hypothetical protein